MKWDNEKASFHEGRRFPVEDRDVMSSSNIGFCAWLSAMSFFVWGCASHKPLPAMSTRAFAELPKVASLNDASPSTASSLPPTTQLPTLPVTAEGFTLTEMALTRSMSELEPGQTEFVFKSDVGRVYLYSRLSVEGDEARKIKHIWYYQDKPVASVHLLVKGMQYRTYSSKHIPPSSRGAWRVDVVTPSNHVLESFPFRVE